MCLQIKFYWVHICTALHRQSWTTERGKLCKYKIYPTGLLREKFAGLQFNYTCFGPKLPVSGSQSAFMGFMKFSKDLTYPCLSFLIHKMKKGAYLTELCETIWINASNSQTMLSYRELVCPSLNPLLYSVIICNPEGKNDCYRHMKSRTVWTITSEAPLHYQPWETAHLPVKPPNRLRIPFYWSYVSFAVHLGLRV